MHASAGGKGSHYLGTTIMIQASWADHKRQHRAGTDGWHYATRRGAGRSLTMPDFKWTGDLRPDRIGPMRPVGKQNGLKGERGWDDVNRGTSLC